MIQHNQIGKYRKKDDVLNAKVGATFVTPKGRTYKFNYEKVGRKYIFILEYRDTKMQVKEVDYNRSNTDDLLQLIDNELNK